MTLRRKKRKGKYHGLASKTAEKILTREARDKQVINFWSPIFQQRGTNCNIYIYTSSHTPPSMWMSPPVHLSNGFCTKLRILVIIKFCLLIYTGRDIFFYKWLQISYKWLETPGSMMYYTHLSLLIIMQLINQLVDKTGCTLFRHCKTFILFYWRFLAFHLCLFICLLLI